MRSALLAPPSGRSHRRWPVQVKGFESELWVEAVVDGCNEVVDARRDATADVGAVVVEDKMDTVTLGPLQALW